MNAQTAGRYCHCSLRWMHGSGLSWDYRWVRGQDVGLLSLLPSLTASPINKFSGIEGLGQPVRVGRLGRVGFSAFMLANPGALWKILPSSLRGNKAGEVGTGMDKRCSKWVQDGLKIEKGHLVNRWRVLHWPGRVSDQPWG